MYNFSAKIKHEIFTNYLSVTQIFDLKFNHDQKHKCRCLFQVDRHTIANIGKFLFNIPKMTCSFDCTFMFSIFLKEYSGCAKQQFILTVKRCNII